MSLSAKKLRPSALQNLSTVSLHKIAQVVGQIVAVLTIPRLLGADDHGRFAFVLAYSFLGQILGDFGTLEVMSRFVPTMSQADIGRLYSRTLFFKIGVGLVCGVLAAALGLILAPWLRLEWAGLIGLGVLSHIVAWVPFHLMLGLNQVGKWMVEQSWRQWALVILLILLYPWLELGGTMVAWALMEVIFCILGLWWARAYWQPAELSLDWAYLKPYIHFGFGFFLANLVGAALYRSSPVLVEALTGQSAQAGYINLAIGLYMMPYLMLTQVAFSLVPTLSEFYTTGQIDKMQAWLHNFVRYSWLFGWLGVIGVWLTVDWGVLLIFGPDYALAAAPLKWISLGIPLAGPLWAGNALATVTGRGPLKFWATLAALLVFLAAALWLIPGYLAAGAAIALSVSILVNVGVLIVSLQPEFTLERPVLLTGGITAIVAIAIIEFYELSVVYWGIF